MTLELRELSLSYPDLRRPVVDGVSLSIAPGEIVGLVGPSGCGKSTMLRLIAGLESPDHGDVFCHGRRLTNEPPANRSVAMVFQDDSLFPDLTVAENIAYGLPKNQAELIAVTLTRLNLAGLGDRLPKQLSGGQRRRVAVARALVRQPKVLLLDEPLSGLDDWLRASLSREIRAAVARVQPATIYVTHDQDEALSMCDRVAVMSAGRIVDVGTPRKVFDRPDSIAVAEYLGRSNFLDVEVSAVSGGRADIRLLGREVTVPAHDRATVDSANTLLVRPHSLAIAWVSAGPGEPLGDVGVVLEVRYLGHRLDVVVDTEHGTVVATIDSWSNDFAVGDLVRVIVNLDRVWVLPV